MVNIHFATTKHPCKDKEKHMFERESNGACQTNKLPFLSEKERSWNLSNEDECSLLDSKVS